MSTRITAQILLFATMVSTIGCDRVTKHVATTTLAGNPDRYFLADTIRLTYVENAGGFLSLGAGLPETARTALFTVGTGVILVATLMTAVWFQRAGWSRFGLALLIGGGASNWVDRVLHGRVVDFMNIGVGPVRTGVFNVADVGIMIGVAILVVSEIGDAARRSRPAPSS